MNINFLSLTLIFIAIAFVATIISAIIKIIFFFHQKDSYRHILKFALIGELLGLFIMILVGAIFKDGNSKWVDPENIIIIPFYLMLAGQAVGLIIKYQNTQKSKSTR